MLGLSNAFGLVFYGVCCERNNSKQTVEDIQPPALVGLKSKCRFCEEPVCNVVSNTKIFENSVPFTVLHHSSNSSQSCVPGFGNLAMLFET
jgi:hypothetical protein